MIHIDISKLEMKGDASLIEAETQSILVAWMMSLDNEYGVECVLDYIKSTGVLLSNIVKHIDEGEDVSMACLNATRDLLKETTKDD